MCTWPMIPFSGRRWAFSGASTCHRPALVLPYDWSLRLSSRVVVWPSGGLRHRGSLSSSDRPADARVLIADDGEPLENREFDRALERARSRVAANFDCARAFGLRDEASASAHGYVKVAAVIVGGGGGGCEGDNGVACSRATAVGVGRRRRGGATSARARELLNASSSSCLTDAAIGLVVVAARPLVLQKTRVPRFS